MSAARTLAGIGLAGAIGACAGVRVAEPPYGPPAVASSAWVEVKTAPPVVKIAEPGPSPGAGYVWIDGQWSFQAAANRWTWDPGQWCRLPKGFAYYAKPSLVRFRKAIGRIDRWNESQQQYEEVDQGDDQWRWLGGQAYGYDAQRRVVPITLDGCVAQRGVGAADK